MSAGNPDQKVYVYAVFSSLIRAFGHRFSCRKNAFFPGVRKIGAAISGPRIADTNFTDTRIFLIFFHNERSAGMDTLIDCVH